MPLSVTEAGLLAAPWRGAMDDATLEQAAKSFYAQTADLTQHGKKDHPTDRIVLNDTAATLALELGAEPAAARAPSISEYVKLPGSGDGFTITAFGRIPRAVRVFVNHPQTPVVSQFEISACFGVRGL